MGWLDRFRRRYRRVDDWDELGDGRVDLRGTVEASELLHEPLSGDPCVAIEYRAWPPTTTIGTGGGPRDTGAFQIDAGQAVDFELVDARGRRIACRVQPGKDVAGLHRELLDRFGVELRTEVGIVEPGVVVRVHGEVVERSSGSGSPHRTDPQVGVVAVDRFWAEPDGA
jgi:hypothetical protein